MANSMVLGLTALISLVPASLLPYRRGAGRRDTVFWVLLAAAVVGPVCVSLVQLADAWSTGLSMTLWISISASMVIFAGLCIAVRDAWRLTPILLPYLCVLAVLAVGWAQVPAEDPLAATVEGWLAVHIATAVVTYALATLAAVAAAAVFLQERALKRKLTGVAGLPSIADGERLQVGLLVAGEGVLAAGILTGMALGYLTTGSLLPFDHKTILSLLAFLVIGLLLLVHFRTGLRGQRAARVVLLAYLLITLAYPGVKFVTDVLIGG